MDLFWFAAVAGVVWASMLVAACLAEGAKNLRDRWDNRHDAQ